MVTKKGCNAHLHYLPGRPIRDLRAAPEQLGLSQRGCFHSGLKLQGRASHPIRQELYLLASVREERKRGSFHGEHTSGALANTNNPPPYVEHILTLDCRWKCLSLLSRPSSEGTVPVSEQESMISHSKFVSSPSSVGTVPSSLGLPKVPRKSNRVILPSSVGKDPDKSC